MGFYGHAIVVMSHALTAESTAIGRRTVENLEELSFLLIVAGFSPTSSPLSE